MNLVKHCRPDFTVNSIKAKKSILAYKHSKQLLCDNIKTVNSKKKCLL